MIGTAAFPFESSSAPRAFLNLLFIAEEESDGPLTAEKFAFDQLGDAANTWDQLSINDFEIKENGYVIIYLSTEGTAGPAKSRRPRCFF